MISLKKNYILIILVDFYVSLSRFFFGQMIRIQKRKHDFYLFNDCTKVVGQEFHLSTCSMITQRWSVRSYTFLPVQWLHKGGRSGVPPFYLFNDCTKVVCQEFLSTCSMITQRWSVRSSTFLPVQWLHKGGRSGAPSSPGWRTNASWRPQTPSQHGRTSS